MNRELDRLHASIINDVRKEKFSKELDTLTKLYSECSKQHGEDSDIHYIQELSYIYNFELIKRYNNSEAGDSVVYIYSWKYTIVAKTTYTWDIKEKSYIVVKRKVDKNEIGIYIISMEFDRKMYYEIEDMICCEGKYEF